jgi:hypothetical protein
VDIKASWSTTHQQNKRSKESIASPSPTPSSTVIFPPLFNWPLSSKRPFATLVAYYTTDEELITFGLTKKLETMNSRQVTEDNDNKSKKDGSHTLITTTSTTRGEHVRKMELFYYEEVIRGPCLGHGSFADVYEVQHFQIHSKNDRNFCQDRRQARTFYSEETKTRSSNNDNDEEDDPTSASSATTTTTTTTRTTTTTSPNTNKYAIKCLRQELFGNHPPSDFFKLFQRAAKDMEIECDLLALIDHPHIVKVYATSASGTLASTNTNSTTTARSSSSSSKEQLLVRAMDFFLIEDRLVGTLTEQINDWNVVKQSILVEHFLFRGVKPSVAKKRHCGTNVSWWRTVSPVPLPTCTVGGLSIAISNQTMLVLIDKERANCLILAWLVDCHQVPRRTIQTTKRSSCSNSSSCSSNHQKQQ